MRELVRPVSPRHAVIPGRHRDGGLGTKILQALNRIGEVFSIDIQRHRVSGHGGHDHEVVGVFDFRTGRVVIPIWQVDHLLLGPAAFHRFAHALDEGRHGQRATVDPIPACLRKRLLTIAASALHCEIRRRDGDAGRRDPRRAATLVPDTLATGQQVTERLGRAVAELADAPRAIFIECKHLLVLVVECLRQPLHVLWLVDADPVGPTGSGTQKRQVAAHVDPRHAIRDSAIWKRKRCFVGMPSLRRKFPTMPGVILA